MHAFKYKISLGVNNSDASLRGLYARLESDNGPLLGKLKEKGALRTDIRGNLLSGVYAESSFGLTFFEDDQQSEKKH